MRGHDLGEILSDGEPDCGIGQGEAAEEQGRSPAEAFWNGEPGTSRIGRQRGQRTRRARPPRAESSSGNGVVHVDFSGPGPDAA